MFTPIMSPCPSLLRNVMVCVLLCTIIPAVAQEKFTVNGRLKIEGSDLGSARAVVYKNGVKERTVTTGLNKFAVDLDLNSNYIISFEKDGYVAKKISFNTAVPADAVAQGFSPFDFSVSLFKQYDDMNIVVFNQPVGVIRYERSKGDFDYDTDYTKSIQTQLQQAMVDVEQKRKEEATKNAEEARRKSEEERERTRLEAEAKKQAGVAAREQARAEQERKNAERAKVEQRPMEVKQPEPVVPVREKRPPLPPPTPQPQRSEHATRLARVVEGKEERRSIEAIDKVEKRPLAEVYEDHVHREEELIVEPNKVMTIVRLRRAERTTEYRRVSHKWGGVFYFRNDEVITRSVYEEEALGDRERLVDAVPRGKME